MNGRKTFLYGLIAGFAVLGGGSAAQACFYTTPLCTGSRSECHPTPRQRLVQERRWAEEGVRRLTAEGQRRLLAGEVDVAAELAEWLVPNVRPVFVVETSCGLMGEPDPGAGRETWRTLFLDVVAGSPLAEADPDDIGYLARIDEEFSFGAPCNAEFRTRFAAFLREQIEAKTLAEAWLFLGARRQSDYPRLVSFERSERTPPVRWAIANHALAEQVRRYVRVRAAGRAVAAAVDRFWAERSGELADDMKLCPAERIRWMASRQQVLADLAERVAEREAERELWRRRQP